MDITAWVAVGIFVLATGQVGSDSSDPVASRAECEAKNVEIKAKVESMPDVVVAYGLTCAEIKVSDGGKLAPKTRPAPSKAPIEQRETGIGLDGRTYL